jgi:hypothetical protein
MRDTDDDEEAEAGYNPFLTNMALSYFSDTVLAANLMNEFSHLSNRPQYEFLLNAVSKRKRFSKWAKAVNSEDLELICDYYMVNSNIGKSYLDLISKEQLEEIREMQNTGGKKNGK